MEVGIILSVLWSRRKLTAYFIAILRHLYLPPRMIKNISHFAFLHTEINLILMSFK